MEGIRMIRQGQIGVIHFNASLKSSKFSRYNLQVLNFIIDHEYEFIFERTNMESPPLVGTPWRAARAGAGAARGPAGRLRLAARKGLPLLLPVACQ
jgi:hypothetical protein